MFIERRLMNKLGISYQDATSLVYKSYSCLGMPNRGTDEDEMLVYREAKRIYRLLQRHEERLPASQPRSCWKRAAGMPL